MDLGLSLVSRLEVFNQNMFIVFPILEEKEPKHQTCLYFHLSSSCTIKYDYFSKRNNLFFMYVVANDISQFCYSVII